MVQTGNYGGLVGAKSALLKFSKQWIHDKKEKDQWQYGSLEYATFKSDFRG